jgi:hypothetical protein
MAELLARIRMAVRHLQRKAGSAAEATRLVRRDVTIDLAERRVFVRGDEVTLTRTQLTCSPRIQTAPGVGYRFVPNPDRPGGSASSDVAFCLHPGDLHAL